MCLLCSWLVVAALFGNRAACAVQADAFQRIVDREAGYFLGMVAVKTQGISETVAISSGCRACDACGGIAIKHLPRPKIAFCEGDIAVAAEAVNTPLTALRAEIYVVSKTAALVPVESSAGIGCLACRGDGDGRGVYAIRQVNDRYVVGVIHNGYTTAETLIAADAGRHGGTGTAFGTGTGDTGKTARQAAEIPFQEARVAIFVSANESAAVGVDGVRAKAVADQHYRLSAELFTGIERRRFGCRRLCGGRDEDPAAARIAAVIGGHVARVAVAVIGGGDSVIRTAAAGGEQGSGDDGGQVEGGFVHGVTPVLFECRSLVYFFFLQSTSYSVPVRADDAAGHRSRAVAAPPVCHYPNRFFIFAGLPP